MYLDPKPLKMIVLVDVSTKESNNVVIKRNVSYEKVSASNGESSLKIHVETMIMSKPYRSENKYDLGKTTDKEQDMGPHVESPDDQHVEPDVEASVPTSSELQAEHPIGSTMEALVDENDYYNFSEV